MTVDRVSSSSSTSSSASTSTSTSTSTGPSEAELAAIAAAKAAAEAAKAAREEARAAAERAKDAQADADKAQSKLAKAEDKLGRATDSLDPKTRASADVISEVKSLRAEIKDLRAAAETKKATARELTSTSLDVADRALRLEKDANATARKAGRTEPYPEAKGVKSAASSGALSEKDQRALFGTTGVSTPQKAANADAKLVRAAFEKSPEKGAEAMESLLAKNDDPAFRRALAKELGPEMHELAAHIEGLSSEEEVAEGAAMLERLKEAGGPAMDEALEPAWRELADKAADTLRSALTADDMPPEEFATKMQELFDAHTSPAFREGLVDALKPQIAGLARRLGGIDSDRGEVAKEVMGALAHMSDALGPKGTRSLAEAFAEGLSDKQAHFDTSGVGAAGRALRDLIAEGGEGGLLGVELAAALQRSGEDQAAGALSAQVTQGLRSLQNDFDSAKAKVDELNAKLGRFVQGFGPGADDEDVQAAIDEFKKTHEEEYARFEELGGQLSHMLGAIGEAKGALSDDLSEISSTIAGGEQNEGAALTEALEKAGGSAESYIETPEGQKELAAAVRKAEGGDPSALDAIREGLGALGTTKKFTDLVVRSVTADALRLATSGNVDKARQALQSLASQAELLGADPKKLQAALDSLGNVIGARNPTQALEDFSDTLSGAGGGTPLVTPGSALDETLRGIGLVLAVPDTIKNLSNLDDADLATALQTLGSAAQVGSEGANLAGRLLTGGADDFASAFPKLSSLLGTAGKLGGWATVVGQGLSAFSKLAKGDFEGAALGGANALGDALLLSGQPYAMLAGAGLKAAAWAGGEIFDAIHDGQDEDDLERFLITTGFDEDFAHTLANQTDGGQNIGSLLVEVAKANGVEADAMIDHLRNLSEEEQARFGETIEPYLHTVIGDGSTDEVPEATLDGIYQFLIQNDLAPAA